MAHDFERQRHPEDGAHGIGSAGFAGANVFIWCPILNSRPASELVVNSSDGHPNARVHAAVADLIFQRLLKDGIVGAQQSSN